MFSPRGPSLGELARQALSSVEGGYDLLAPKFDHTPFRTPDGVLDATAGALRPLGPFGRGLDVCCGTGAGMRVLESVCQERIIGVDFSTGMLARARRALPGAGWVRADVRALPFAGAFDLAVSFWALGHSCPPNRPRCSPESSARCGQPGSSLSRSARRSAPARCTRSGTT
jgi:SAM-dependent methyltransferase